MKVLYIINSLEKGGAQRYALDLCLELNKRPEISYKLLLLQGENEFEYLTEDIEYEVFDDVFIPSIRGESTIDVNKYKQIIENFQPDIIHTHLFSSEIFSAIYVPENVAFVTHGHDNMKQFRNLSLNSFFAKESMTNFYEKQYLINKKYKKNRNSYFIANSPDTLEYFRNSVPGFLKQNVKLIEYGFDFPRFHFPEKEIFSADKEKFVIINVSRFEKRKNQHFIVEIAKILKQRNFNFEINLLGIGECLDEVKQKIKDSNLESDVYVRGNINYVEEWLQKSDLYLHSAYYEPFGLVILEAMASGLPCVILDGIGNRDLVIDDYNGYLFRDQNAELFADKIIELARNKSLLAELSSNAIEFSKKYDMSVKTDELVEFYESIIVREK